MSSDGIVGYKQDHEYMLKNMLREILQENGSLIIRQFLPFDSHETENGIKIPFKNLYGFFLGNNSIVTIKKEELKEDFETDYKTGKKIKQEKGVLYCELLLSISPS